MRPRTVSTISAGRSIPAHGRLLLLAAAALLLGWVVAPTHVPLYNGVEAPDEPYRYVAPPPKYRATPPPTSATATVKVDNGVSCCDIEARSAERGPQVLVYVPRGGIAASGAVDVAATPQAQPAGPVPEEKGKFEGNTYSVTLRGSGNPHLTADASRAIIQLRALSANQPGPNVYYRPAGNQPWRKLVTGRAGRDIYESQFVGAGDYVLVRLPSNKGSAVKVFLGIFAVPALLVVALLLLRLRRSPDSKPRPPASDGSFPPTDASAEQR